MLYTLYILAHIHGHLAIATHDLNSMKLCLAMKADMAVVLKEYDPIIACEPKLGEI